MDKDKADNLISKKKKHYPIKKELRSYLRKYERINKGIPVRYDDLKRYTFSIPLLDKEENDTLWKTVFYDQSDMVELNKSLTLIYSILKAGGKINVMKHLSVDRIDFCSFGNSQPFRIKIINNYNDNYDYYYIKKADASRIYGLELEDILSPNRIGYTVHEDTLFEEHIAGIPGDVFIDQHLGDTNLNETRIAKEFIKFNERCFVKLLGDMRSYNYVIDVTPDFDDIQYRIRAIDFDQQSYEGRMNLYKPQFFKENYPFVALSIKTMNPETVYQYQTEERALIAGRMKSSAMQLKALLDVMVKDEISNSEKVHTLKQELAKHYKDERFLECKSMGEIVKTSLQIIIDTHLAVFTKW